MSKPAPGPCVDDRECEFCDADAECCKPFDNSYGEMLRPFITVCTPCWNRHSIHAQAALLVDAEKALEGMVKPYDGITWAPLTTARSVLSKLRKSRGAK